MKKHITNVKGNVYQVTTIDERWYAIPGEDPAGNPIYRYIPSVTWICQSYPKEIFFYKWLAEKGWDEAQAIKQTAGDKGSKVHHAIEKLIDGETIKATDKIKDSDGQEVEFEPEEWEAVISFYDWVQEVKPKFLASETLAINKEYGYAGMIDCIAEINGKKTLIDWKTSQSIWTEYELQLSAYAHADGIEVDQVAILQIGYKRNKKKYKWNIIDDKFDIFLNARAIWESEHGKEKPRQIDMPLEIKL